MDWFIQVDIADFELLAGPPRFAPSSVDWEVLQEELGLRFPEDYMQLFQRYPNLQLDKFLGIFAPESDVASFVAACHEVVESLRMFAGDEVILLDDSGNGFSISPFPFYPEVDGLLPWGATENGDTCLWKVSVAPSVAWPVVVTNGANYWIYEGGILSFIGELLDGSIACPIFPDDFPSSGRIDQFEV